MDKFPERLLIEVKTSRVGNFSISDRDLAPLDKDGFLCALLPDRKIGGPIWAFVPRDLIQPGTFDQAELFERHVNSMLSEAVQQGWSNWLLNQKSIEHVLKSGAQSNGSVEWVRTHHPPPENSSKGLIRQLKTREALDKLHEQIDDAFSEEIGSQMEGKLHQYLLEDVMMQIGYKIVHNDPGVPDINATRLPT